MREPDTASAWAEWDDEQDQQDIRRRALRARTEDEYLDTIREAGGLGAGLRLMAGAFPPPPDPTTYRGREQLLLPQKLELERAVLLARQDAYGPAYREARAAGQDEPTAHKSALVAEEAAERAVRSEA
jgi:hypothetical protein